MMRIVTALIFGGIFAWMAFSRPDEAEEPEGKGPRYRPYLYGWLLPGYAAAMLAAGMLSRGRSQLSETAAAWMIMMFLHISLYFVLLSLAQPLLRRYLRPGSCALLWLTPNYLYLAMNSSMITPPKWVISLPQGLVERLAAVWLAGALVVLPQRHYTPEELKLIFRHELVHIGREDAWNKFFVAFCIAMCWFNPLMWLAMGRSSEDLELSCDETVLSSLGEGERRQYADLILRTAGDGRGFTTCLSASASALRYRLKSIVKPGKKISGALLVGVAFILLFVSFGQISLAYEAGTGESAIYRGMVHEVSLRQVRRDENGRFRKELECRDEGALTDYLTSLPLSEIVDGGDDFYGQTGEQIVLLYDAPEDILSVILWDDYIKVVPFWENRAYYYHVSGGLDWGKLDQLLEETA